MTANTAHSNRRGDEDQPTETSKPLRSKILGGALSVVVIAIIFGFILPAIADYDEVWTSLTDMTWIEVTTLAALALFNIWTYLPVLTGFLPGLTQRQAFVVNNSSTAVSNTMPGGAALGIGVSYGMYRSWGFGTSQIALSVVASGIWNTFVKLGLPLVALALLAIFGEASASLVGAALLGVALLIGAVTIFGLILKSEDLARRLGELGARLAAPMFRLLRRSPPSGWGDTAVAFRADIIDLVETRWPRLTVAVLVSHITLYAVLLVALRHLGVSEHEVSWATVLAAYAFGRLITAIPVTPGGLGVIELGYVAALSVGVSGATEGQIVAAVLLFRAITFVPPIIIGALTYLTWKRRDEWRDKESEIPSIS